MFIKTSSGMETVDIVYCRYFLLQLSLSSQAPLVDGSILDVCRRNSCRRVNVVASEFLALSTDPRTFWHDTNASLAGFYGFGLVSTTSSVHVWPPGGIFAVTLSRKRFPAEFAYLSPVFWLLVSIKNISDLQMVECPDHTVSEVFD